VSETHEYPDKLAATNSAHEQYTRIKTLVDVQYEIDDVSKEIRLTYTYESGERFSQRYRWLQ
jgi:hypothetical protein